ncbi:hypothetical protein SSS_00312 [Sarcoptes scabiei]|uniref:Endonuclease/exonuclease/phosphatase domain-containing protein n=1 Tax=Sarcoptes scabiei TaxID=52283 RepID=A0A834RF13_SARSC|nr:hypothetical protein SSS_00312 [Sarcoptes scabiei]
MKNRNPRLMDVVLRVAPEVFQIISQQLKNNIYIDFQSCRVEYKSSSNNVNDAINITIELSNVRIHRSAKAAATKKVQIITVKAIISGLHKLQNHNVYKNDTNHAPNTEHCPIYLSHIKRLRIHQQNLRKSSTATQDLLSNLEHSNTDLILIQEPHTNSNNKIMGFPSSSSMYQANSEIIPKTAITVNVSTVYIEPNSISSIHENLVRKLFKTYENVPLIDPEILMLGIQCGITGSQTNTVRPTCLTINGSSIIDLTLTNHKATPFIRNWNSNPIGNQYLTMH